MTKTIAVAALFLAMLGGGASAADLISYPTSTARQVPIADAAAGYDWNGFYTGVFAAYQHGAASGDRFGLGVDGGVNTTVNFFLAGAEVAVEGLTSDAGTSGYAEAVGRAGVLLNDNTLLYGAAGYGLDTNGANSGDVLAGGGLEYALTDAVSVRAQYLHGFPITGTDAKDQVTLGAQFHF